MRSWGHTEIGAAGSIAETLQYTEAGALGFFPKDELLSPARHRLIEDRTDDKR